MKRQVVVPLETWTNQDFLDGACSHLDIGKPKPIEQSAEQVVQDLPPATMAELKQAALRVARGKGSYDEFLEENPGFHQKFLLSMVKEPLPPGPARVDVNISWLSANRLSYKAVEAVDDATDIVPRALPSGEVHEAQALELERSWKPSTISPQQEFDRLPPLPPRSKPDIEIK
jgi:hypothetical protein